MTGEITEGHQTERHNCSLFKIHHQYHTPQGVKIVSSTINNKLTTNQA